MASQRLSRYLGVDYGERRIGLALSDPLGIIAKPFTIIDSQKESHPQNKIAAIASENEVIGIVVGIPYTLKGTESPQTIKVQNFIESLKQSTNTKIIGVDERLSSVSAEKALIEQGVKTGHNKGRIDETAAAIILQEYLDSKS
ncbi:MAG: Holliday junction resolvase RuvX [Candidatus Marinimicrobia bacterium]|nr:Holliday junction resolvase RuvX [Candidatus Neomarinimicrobiota bacterium]